MTMKQNRKECRPEVRDGVHHSSVVRSQDA